MSLIAAIGFLEKVEVGTDVVCANERLTQDNAYIEKDGFFDWVDMHRDVFAESELNHMKLSPVDIRLADDEESYGFDRDATSRIQRRTQTFAVEGPLNDLVGSKGIGASEVIDKKLRRFYAMWCLRETYVKMTGEALLAPWLRELEITGAEGPSAKETLSENDTSLECGEVEKDFVVFLKGGRVMDVRMELAALGGHYMVGGAIRASDGVDLSSVGNEKWQELDIVSDVIAFAESH